MSACKTNPRFVQVELASVMEYDFDSGTVVGVSERSPDKSSPNDDSAIVVQCPNGAVVMVVADGVGGYPQGFEASRILIESIEELVCNIDPNNHDLRPAILDGIEAANLAILKLDSGAATTAVVAEIHNQVVRVYNVGDSMALVLRKSGSVKWKSISHSPVGYGIESGLLDERMAMSHHERHIVSNVVGSIDMCIEIGPPRRLIGRDTVLLASDGLFDNLHLPEIQELATVGQPKERVEAMLQLAQSRMKYTDLEQPCKPDDLTLLLYTR